jgi:hypothetical protein
MKTFLFTAAWCSFMSVGLDAQPAGADAAVDADVHALAKAYQTGDAGTISNLTYGPMVAAMGGETNAYLKIDSQFGIMKAESEKVTGFKILRPYLRATGEDHDYILIPTRIDLQIGDHDFEEESYFLAIRFRGARRWHYVWGSPSLPSQSDGLFPDLPKSLVLPAVKRVQID